MPTLIVIILLSAEVPGVRSLMIRSAEDREIRIVGFQVNWRSTASW